MPQIATFGALLKFLVEFERHAAEFYEGRAGDSRYGDLMAGLARANRKRASTLERVRRENVTEMILEPIEGLSSEQVPVPDSSDEDWLAQAIALEHDLGKFYSEAAQKARLALGEVRRLFVRLAEENGRRRAELKALEERGREEDGT